METKLTSTHNKPTVLIVDDDLSVIASISMLLKQNGFATVSAQEPTSAIEQLETNHVDIVIQDMNFSRNTSGEEGMALLQDIKSRYPSLPVVLMTAWGSIELAVEGIKYGANDFITKPWNNQALVSSLQTALALNVTPSKQPLSRQALDELYDFSNIVGEDPVMLDVLATVGRVATTQAPVLILGESGTGKELIADAIHRNSKRANQTFNKVNLGGLSTTLFESEMFGHVRGAFTDAKHDRVGQFETAHKGSLFLDEMGDLDSSSQVKLLRVLQDQSFQPVGSSQTKKADVRVISATNKDLYEMVKNGEFREDLLYRINLITIQLPPLRQRRGDILPLAKQHLDKVVENYQLEPFQITRSAERYLEAQPWPGNVRQLTQTIERAVLMSENTLLDVKDFESCQAISGKSAHDKSSESSVEALGDLPANMTLEQMEKVMIENALASYPNNLSKVADTLGISRAALYRRLDKHGIVT